MKTDVFIHVKCGGESTASLELEVSLEGMDILDRMLQAEKRGDTDLFPGEDHPFWEVSQMARLIGLELVLIDPSSPHRTNRPLLAVKLTLAGRLTAKAWSRDNG